MSVLNANVDDDGSLVDPESGIKSHIRKKPIKVKGRDNDF